MSKFGILLRKKRKIQKMISSGRRSDGRELEELRELTVTPGILKKAEGSAEVCLGKTRVLVGVKIEVGTPFDDTPDEGVLVCNAEFNPIAHPTWRPGPPGEDAIEVARVVDRGLRSAKVLDLNDLCLIPGEMVHLVFIDLFVLNHDGNLIDASAIGAITALLNAEKPIYNCEKGEAELTEKREPLKLLKKPVAVTLVKIGDNFVLDPTEEEEEVMDARLTVTVDEVGNICTLQKAGSSGLTREEISKCLETAVRKAPELIMKIPSQK